MTRPRRSICTAGAFLFAGALLAPAAFAEDTSPAALLQWFDGSYQTQFNRTADLFMAGYGGVWIPPTGRADSGNQSVGYDAYDRFDLGSWDDKTLYGTEQGLKLLAQRWHQAGANVYADLIWNHNGFSDLGTPQFFDAGGYPGFTLVNPDGPTEDGGVDGDFHGAFEGGDLNGRLAGLIDIKHETDWQYIRNPVNAGDPDNIPAGSSPDLAGRIANVPDPANARFYPDRDMTPIMVYNPDTGQSNIAIYPFNPNDPTAGDPVKENARDYLMRNARWLVQEIGVDGFRLDAARHFEPWVMELFDQAVYRASTRTLLNGSQFQVFSFSEAASSDRNFVNSVFIEKTINPNDIGTVGGNRDALDFSYFFAVRDNLSANGVANSWFNVVGSDLDAFDDGLQNGSAGVKFAASHDDFGAAMSNVSYALVLTLPGNANVYYDASEFGDRSFPKDGRGDALGGYYGDNITTLLDIRNTHGRGNYRQRWLEKENYAYERSKSMLVLLSNRNDSGYDARTVNTDFLAGTPLIELTGNAHDWNQLVGNNDIPELIVVNSDKTANVRFLRNGGADRGYLVYGVAGPQSTNGVELTNVASILAGGTPTAATNGTTLLTDLHVIHDDSFTVRLATSAVNLLGFYRDPDADGDNAMFRFDGGLNLNGNAGVDNTAPGHVAYGFEEFVTTRTPGYGSATGNGLYEQLIDATQLSEGEHYITVRAFRHRSDGGPTVYSDFKKVIYVDRLPPISAVYGAKKVNGANSGDRDVLFESVDLTANSMHVFLDLPAVVSDADILNMALGGQGASQRVDTDLYKKFFAGLVEGNHVYTVVTFEPTGTTNVQRFAGNLITDAPGAGLGDLNFNGNYAANDLNLFKTVFLTRNSQFNPAGDLSGDGLIDWIDLLLLGDRLVDVNASTTTLAAYNTVLDDLTLTGDANNDGVVDAGDYLAVETLFGSTGSDNGLLLGDANDDGRVDGADWLTVERNFGLSLYGASVPEPTSAAVLLLAAALMRGRGSRRRSR